MVDDGRFEEGEASTFRPKVAFALLRRLLPELEAVVGVVEASLLRASRRLRDGIPLLVGVGPSLSLSSPSEGEREAEDSYMLGKGAPKGSWKRGSSARGGAVSAGDLIMDEDLAGTGSGGARAEVTRATVGVVRCLDERVDLVEEGRDECREGEVGGGAMTLPGASNAGRTGEAKVVAKADDMTAMCYRERLFAR